MKRVVAVATPEPDCPLRVERERGTIYGQGCTDAAICNIITHTHTVKLFSSEKPAVRVTIRTEAVSEG